MSTPVFSFSKLSCLEKCPHQYFRRYRNGERPQTRGIEQFLGIQVHAVVEAVEAEDLDRTQAARRLAELWDAHFNSEELIDVRERGWRWWYDHAVRCVFSYYEVGRPPEGSRIVGNELKLGMPLLYEPMASFIGILDRALRLPSGDVEVWDFKTGRKPARRYFEADHQLPLYSELLIHELGLNPELDPGGDVPSPADVVTVRRVYLGENCTEPLDVTPRRRAEAVDWAESKAVEALALEEQWAEEEYPQAETRESPLCSWCSYKPSCPAWGSATL